MSLRWNLAAGFANSAWSATLALVSVPLYVAYLGVEAYGLVGFFAALQGLFTILDMGLSPTMNREVARCRASGNIAEGRNLLHTLAGFYWGTGALIAALIWLAADAIAFGWLQNTSLSGQTVRDAIILMGVTIAFRWPLGIYMGALMGAERLGLVSVISMAMTTLQTVGTIAVLAYGSATIEAFFLTQAAMSLLLALAMRHAAWLALRTPEAVKFDIAGLKRIWRFSAGLGVTTIVGTVLTNADKILLSKIATLEQLGHYTIASTVARTLTMIIIPIFNVAYPRMTTLFASGNTNELITTYRSGTRALTAVIFPASAFIILFAPELITFWMGNERLADSVFWPLCFLTLGTAFNGIMYFPFALQLAAGRSKLAATIAIILLAIHVPLLLLLSFRYGLGGAAAAWALVNAFYIFLGAWMTHRVILKGLALRWITSDVGIPFLTTCLVMGIGASVTRQNIAESWVILLIGALLAAAASSIIIIGSPHLRSSAREWLRWAVLTVSRP